MKTNPAFLAIPRKTNLTCLGLKDLLKKNRKLNLLKQKPSKIRIWAKAIKLEPHIFF